MQKVLYLQSYIILNVQTVPTAHEYKHLYVSRFLSLF